MTFRTALDRLYASRDRLLADERFQAWAASFPLTRWIARRRANALFDLTAGFVYAQILSAIVQLRVLEILRENPAPIADLAPRLGLGVDATGRLVKAGVALGLFMPRGESETGALRYGLGMDGAALLGNPGARAMIAHHDRFYADLADPVALLRGKRETQLSTFWPYAKDHGVTEGDDAATYSGLMSASQPLVARDILDAYDLSRHGHLVDCAGGDGTFLNAVADRAPDLQLTLYDLPPVAALATQKFAATGLGQRIAVSGGDLWRDPLPANADIITLVRVLHDHDDTRVANLLRRLFDALPLGGTLLIAEPMVTGVDDARVGDAYFAFYLLAMGSGRARKPSEYEAMLIAAGFTRIARVPTRRPLLCSMLSARKNIIKKQRM